MLRKFINWSVQGDIRPGLVGVIAFLIFFVGFNLHPMLAGKGNWQLLLTFPIGSVLMAGVMAREEALSAPSLKAFYTSKDFLKDAVAFAIGGLVLAILVNIFL